MIKGIGSLPVAKFCFPQQPFVFTPVKQQGTDFTDFPPFRYWFVNSSYFTTWYLTRQNGGINLIKTRPCGRCPNMFWLYESLKGLLAVRSVRLCVADRMEDFIELRLWRKRSAGVKSVVTKRAGSKSSISNDEETVIRNCSSKTHK